MSATTISRRGAKAAAAERAAKERRQHFIVAGLAALLVIVLAFELPTLLSRGGSSKTSAPAATSRPPVLPATHDVGHGSARQRAELRKALKQPAHDLFVGSVDPAADTLGSVPNPPGLHDPFASASSPEAATAPVAPKPPGPAIKGTIVIGTPGAGTVAEHGWIVILASIPTAQGRARSDQLRDDADGPESARFPFSTRRIADRSAAATGSSTPARSRRSPG